MAKQQTGYTPTPVPQQSTTLPRWLTQELRRVSQSITTILQMLGGKLPPTVYTVATLPTGVTAGCLANVSDGTAGLSWGVQVIGGGAASYLVRFNGSKWTVVGS